MPLLPQDESEHRAWLLSHLRDAEGARLVVDLGCGAGKDVAELAARTGPDTRLVGIDSWPAQLERAQARCGADPRVSFREFVIGSGPLPLEDGSVDIVFSNNLLECLAEPERLPDEIARVLRPGGQVVCAHWDWDSQTIDVEDKSLARRFVHAFADFQQKWMQHVDGWMGRRLWRIFQHGGRFHGRVHARTLINTVFEPPWYGYGRIADFRQLVDHRVVSAAEYEQLVKEVEAAARGRRYFYSITGYAYVGGVRA
jgi:SAM-dependent methyltransferase